MGLPHPPEPPRPGRPQHGWPALPLPESIRTAVGLMYVGAAVAALSFLVTIVGDGADRDRLWERMRDEEPQLTADQIDRAIDVGMAAVVIGGSVVVALWLWMANKNRAGRSWARTLSAVFGGLAIVGGVIDLVGVVAGDLNGQTIFSIVNLGLAVTILALLYRPESAPHYGRHHRGW